MTTPPAVYGQFGMTLAFAERALTNMLHEHLAERDVEPDSWYALRLIASRTPDADRETLIDDLEGSRNVAASAHELLARLEAEGLIRGDAQVDLTDEGDKVYRDLREYVSGPTVRLLDQFDIQDIETTVRTMRAITERATEIGRASLKAEPATTSQPRAPSQRKR
jgi:hypothetical protein